MRRVVETVVRWAAVVVLVVVIAGLQGCAPKQEESGTGGTSGTTRPVKRTAPAPGSQESGRPPASLK